MKIFFNRKRFLALTFPVLAAGLIFTFYNGIKQRNNNEVFQDIKNAENKEALLIIEYNKNKQRRFKGEVIEEMTLRDVLLAASQAGNFNFTANNRLVVIDNIFNNSEKEWNCYLNNQKVEEDFKEVNVKPKNIIVCKYE